ncbi:RHS repeat domain-containing protein [Cellulophaga sp. Hel_I_12]|uniref:RHS repeat domain-containing protein n=1 Tax=Cellulophaga sp. Hel_I_12 TaxID=1249972 RepID=UPI000647F6FD|nr:RHS repeat domain-containing protein [Cellulophaga sp. Hel_I_12]
MRIFLVLIFSINCLTAQELPTIVPPSPEAAALANFTDVPVSHYTGLPNISVPIYTIQQKGIQIPINLSYHARGVQVSETAPRTGMGWSLHYGGSISRQVRGKSDEAVNYGYLSNRNHFMSYSDSLSTRQTVSNMEMSYPDYDFYPDQFSFSAGGLNGKFVLDYKNGQPVIQSFGDVKITYSMYNTVVNGISSIGSFVITDSNGNKYYFGESKDSSRTGRDFQSSTGLSIFFSGNVVPDSQSSTYATTFSSWKLMDIETIYGELISYYYQQNNTGFYRKSYDKHQTGDSNATNSVSGMSDINGIHTRLSNISNYETQLSKITFNQNKDSIVFKKEQAIREDYDGHALDKIMLYNGAKLIKTFNLNYSYTVSVDATNLLGFFSNNNQFSKSFKRMFLDSVEQVGSNGQKLPPYTFTYDPQILPSTFSSRQDYWGYYNGATNNGPFTRMFDYGTYVPDRRVDILKSEAGLLKQINYPTGGITKFTYEHNKGRIPFAMASLKLPKINPGSNDEMTIVLRKSDFNYNVNTGGYTPYTIQLPANTSVSYTFSCFHFSDANDPNPPPSCLFYFTLNNSSVNLDQNYIFNTGSSTSSTIKVFPISWNGDPNLHLNNYIDFQVTLEYDIPDTGDLLYGPGKRIQKIENISAAGSSTFKEYEYSFPYDEDLQSFGGPSGSIIGLPSYINTVNNNGFRALTHYNDTGSAYSSFQPNSIGYSGVIEYHGTKEDNIGKTEYLFTNFSDSGGDYYEFPYHPPTDNEWLRGKNIKTIVRKKVNTENDTLTKVKEVYNKYLYSNNEYIQDFEFSGFVDPSFEFTPVGTIHDWVTSIPSDSVKSRTLFKLPLFMRQGSPLQGDINFVPGYRIYHLTGGTVDLLSTTVKDYFDNGNFNKETIYSYNYNIHYQVKSTMTIDSKGNSMLNKFYYPKDLNYTPLLDQHRLSEVLKTETYHDLNNDDVFGANELLSKMNTNYEVWPSNLVLPEFVQSSKGTNPLESRIIYHDYDDFGNPLEVSKADGIHVSYVWGYNKQYPVAKIENATQAQIAIVNLNMTLINNSATTGSDMEAELDKLRTNLTNAMVTTYTYDPLIGVTSMTDPRGNTIYYHYDGFNRLEFVKDADGNLVTDYEYRYKGQQ